MKSKHKTGDTAAELRKRAEEKFSSDQPAVKIPLAPEETEKLLHELQVHQIELEMQNEELRCTQEDLEASRARYFDLYDLAPVGYLRVSDKGLILEANLTAGNLLGIIRGGLINQPISRFIFREDQDIYYQHRSKLLETGAVHFCELRLTKPDGSLLWAQLSSIASRQADGTLVSRVALSDITERKKVAALLQEKVEKLDAAMSKIKVLGALLPICQHCKKIRDDKGYWNQLETYISQHTDTLFSHGICDDCLNRYYPEEAKLMRQEAKGKG